MEKGGRHTLHSEHLPPDWSHRPRQPRGWLVQENMRAMCNVCLRGEILSISQKTKNVSGSFLFDELKIAVGGRMAVGCMESRLD